jgi:iron(II)-dependent oxidoreductase
MLEEARERTLSLVAGLDADALHRQHTPLLSPLVWDLGHIAAFEDLWVCRVAGLELLRPDLAGVYDATLTPRARRSQIPFLRDPEVREYMAAVRERTLSVAERDPYSWVWDLLLQHEQQHTETMLQALKLAPPGTCAPERRALPAPAAEPPGGMVLIEAGPFLMGDPGQRFAYDNERPRHEVELPAFWIDRLPVTNGEYLEFLEDGGYRRRELWSGDGWAWREAEGVERPLYWNADGTVRDFERSVPLDPRLPVMHLAWYEADAYARWRGARLPTEAEWEKAAAWDPVAGAARRHPWGDDPPDLDVHANLDQTAYGPAPAGAYAAGASAYGVLGLLGDCWEWTASPFGGYPGFRSFPYREYSEVFFGGGYRVLRGASWATRPAVARCTFRNWDYPQRRQIFSGFRCARDA